MRKFMLVVWILDTVALAWLFGYIILYGSNPDRSNLASDLGAIWGAIAGIYGWNFISAKWKAKKAKAAGVGS
jgi:hypothetical protein